MLCACLSRVLTVTMRSALHAVSLTYKYWKCKSYQFFAALSIRTENNQLQIMHAGLKAEGLHLHDGGRREIITPAILFVLFFKRWITSVLCWCEGTRSLYCIR